MSEENNTVVILVGGGHAAGKVSVFLNHVVSNVLTHVHRKQFVKE